MKTTELATKPLSNDLLRKINAYWRAANYLSVGQIYLNDNPLLTCSPRPSRSSSTCRRADAVLSLFRIPEQ